MNFIEFEKHVNDMKLKLQGENVNPEDVKIEYTKCDGYNCLWAIKGEKIITYFKW